MNEPTNSFHLSKSAICRYENVDSNIPNALLKALNEKCGARFFIKYYKQINLLPLRDVNVKENYDSAEKYERLRTDLS